jgi:hypothetical protein
LQNFFKTLLYTIFNIIKKSAKANVYLIGIDDYSEMVNTNKRNIASLAAKGGWMRPSRTYNRMPHYPF